MNSVTSVNVKKAGMASRNIVMKKQYTLLRSAQFAVVFGLLGFFFALPSHPIKNKWSVPKVAGGPNFGVDSYPNLD